MRGNAWLKMKLLAPYGGITRIRFKGSSENFRTSQHIGSPACRFENRTRGWEVNARIMINPASEQRAGGSALLFEVAPERNYPADLAGAACLMLVWKMASHFPSSIFQTVPAL